MDINKAVITSPTGSFEVAWFIAVTSPTYASAGKYPPLQYDSNIYFPRIVNKYHPLNKLTTKLLYTGYILDSKSRVILLYVNMYLFQNNRKIKFLNIL